MRACVWQCLESVSVLGPESKITCRGIYAGKREAGSGCFHVQNIESGQSVADFRVMRITPEAFSFQQRSVLFLQQGERGETLTLDFFMIPHPFWRAQWLSCASFSARRALKIYHAGGEAAVMK